MRTDTVHTECLHYLLSQPLWQLAFIGEQKHPVCNLYMGLKHRLKLHCRSWARRYKLHALHALPPACMTAAPGELAALSAFAKGQNMVSRRSKTEVTHTGSCVLA